MNGETMRIEGAGQGVLAMALMALRQDEEREADVSAKRSDAARSMHMQANAYKSMQLHANAGNKNKNKKEEKETEQESEFIDETEAQRIAGEHERVLDAAEDAGFKMSNDVRSRLIALYAVHGLDRMLEGYRSCVDHGAPNLAYLNAVLKGEPKKAKATVSAQAYTQRDYSGEQEDAMMRMIKGVV